MTSIRIDGLDELRRKLGQLGTNAILRPAMQRTVALVHNRMADYPAQRPGSSYVRTGTLGRRWTTRVDTLADGVRGKVGNNAVYGPFVQSSMFQATVHSGRWQTDQDVMTDEMPNIERFFQDAVNEALR